ncbi:AarF/ABC1/UbiB kinase family protein [Candidatus Bealeia paramacronuclearis]|uniref:AarF/ABC1/UbiB kinase family protein n=2 Tax=Candidatus Bealeia paramacronuclearis TaxID=1921001 RepID=A0ABZ2C4B2_9PROT|nr:AarF/ABC1/UbiB kinase family protein [Candidatus Bealeia paramacronuclearis]
MDQGGISLRLKRYAETTSTVGGLMARLFGEKYLGISMDHGGYAGLLKSNMGNLKGPVMKIAQILAMVPDMLPQEYAEEFLTLQSNAPAMGWLFVKRRMKAELGPDWENLFQAFTHEATAAASLGQVHKVRNLEGRDLACKLQYPDMASAVNADLAQLKLFLNLYAKTSGAIDPQNLYLEIAERLHEELDYKREADHIRLFRAIFEGQNFVHVPEVIPELSTSRLLTMSWMPGQKLLEFKDAPQEIRNKICENLFRVWYFPFYKEGVLHGDPHLGNYTVREDLSLNLLDYGCIRLFPKSFIASVIQLYHALQNNDEELARNAYESWGFGTMTPELLTILNLWASYLYGPLLDDRIRPIDESLSGQNGRKIAGEILSELKKIGGVRPPREFVFMDRAAVALGSVFIHLKAELNWHRLYEELISSS